MNKSDVISKYGSINNFLISDDSLCPICKVGHVRLSWNKKTFTKYCSKSCTTKAMNIKNVKNGTHNLLKENGGSLLAKNHNRDMVNKGTHPFLKENFDENTRIENGIKISKKRKEEFLNAKGRFSKINIAKSCRNQMYKMYKNTNTLYFYLAEVPNKDFLKFGITCFEDLNGKSFKYHHPDLINPKLIFKSDKKSIIELEFKCKTEFVKNEDVLEFHRYEYIKACQKDEFMKFISSCKEVMLDGNI